MSISRSLVTAALVAVLPAGFSTVLGGCEARSAPAPAAPSVPVFELSCRASNTASHAQMHCVRTDTRNGEILLVDHTRLPVSRGPTASAPGGAGRYHTECTATQTDTRSDFYCVRIDTQTGDMMLVNLLEVGQIPAPSK
jgi:hypothetical protein